MDFDYLRGRILEFFEKKRESKYQPNQFWPRMRDHYHIEILSREFTTEENDLPIAIIDLVVFPLKVKQVKSNIEMLGWPYLNELLQELEKELVDIQPSSPIGEKIEIDRPIETPARGKPGRHHSDDDVWAHEQVNKYQRPKDEVYSEWKGKPGVQKRNLQDPERHFKRIIKPDWMTK